MDFGIEWERLITELEEVGLPIDPATLALDYIVKIGVEYAERVRLDRRPRPDGKGGEVIRIGETWEEYHEVLTEIEGMKTTSKAFQQARTAAQTPHTMAIPVCLGAHILPNIIIFPGKDYNSPGCIPGWKLLSVMF